MACRRTARLALWLFAAFLACSHGKAIAGNRKISVRVDSLLATNNNAEVDSRLAPVMRGRLAKTFDYSSYKLLKHDEASTACGQAVAFNLPDGRILHVAPLMVEGNMIAMELVMFEGARSIMRTELRIPRGADLMLGWPLSDRQAHITSIIADVSGTGDDEAAQAPSTRAPSVTITDTPRATPGGN